MINHKLMHLATSWFISFVRRPVSHICLVFLFLALLLSPPSLFAAEEEMAREREKQQDQEKIFAETYQQLEIFSNVLSMLQENYVEELDTPDVIKGAIEGMLQSLDPHSSYLTPEEFQDLREETSGQFSGLGIEVMVQEDRLTIVSPIAKTPAAKAGLKAGDIIVAIDGKKTKEIGNYQAIEKLRGPTGSTALLSILRKGWADPRDFSITRARIPLVSVEKERLCSGLGYIRITSFQKNTAVELKKALESFIEEKPIQGLILDLRNNPGGLLEEAVDVADVFLNQGTIVYTKGRREDQNVLFKAHNNSRNTEYPLVILINEGSASASEIVAGAIQSHKRGIIVGTRSFGKGSVQSIIPLPDGAGLRMTTAKYYTPDDKSIQAVGITPDVIVPLPDTLQFNGFDNTVVAEDAKMPNPLPEEQTNAVRRQFMVEENSELDKKLTEDNQLKAAYNILVSLVLYTEQLNKSAR